MSGGAGPLRVALIGAGDIAQSAHLPAWQEQRVGEVSVVVDRFPSRLEQVREKYGVSTSEAVDEVLADPEIGAVHICTPPDTHAELVERALSSGKDVLVEKPAMPAAADVARLASAAREKDRIVMVGENWLFSAAIEGLRRLIAQRSLNHPFMVRAWHLSDLYVLERTPTAQWTFDAEIAHRGYLLHAAIHTIAVITELLGPVETVSARFRTDDLAPLEHSGILNLEMASGCLVSVDFSGRSAHSGERRLGFELLYPDCRALVDVLAGKVRAESYGQTLPLNPLQPSLGYREQIAHFIACVERRQPPATSLERVLPAHQVVELAYRSAAEGGRVQRMSGGGDDRR